MSDPRSEVRCPGCGKLLAERDRDGSLYVRTTRLKSVLVRDGDVECTPCGLSVSVSRSTRVDAVGAVHRVLG